MQPEVLAAMRDASRQIELFLGKYGGGALPAEGPLPDLAPVSEAVDRVGRRLQQNPPLHDPDPATRAEVDEYVEKLRRLNLTLEKLQPQLEARRDAIRQRLGKIRQALNWVDSFHQTRE
jgi:hypothetical protein